MLSWRWLFVGLDCMWLLAVFFVIQRRASVAYIYAILAVLLLEAAFTVNPLFLPLIKHLNVGPRLIHIYDSILCYG